jgi:hypothetical protein
LRGRNDVLLVAVSKEQFRVVLPEPRDGDSFGFQWKPRIPHLYEDAEDDMPDVWMPFTSPRRAAQTRPKSFPDGDWSYRHAL